MMLFSPNLKRTELLQASKKLEPAPTHLKIHIHRNHAFEPIASVIAPFLHHAGFMGEFVYSDYDDSLSFNDLRLESRAKEVQNTQSHRAESSLDSKDSKDSKAPKDSMAQKNAHILFIDTARYSLQGEQLDGFILERALALREISPSPILVLLLGEAKENAESKKDLESVEVKRGDSEKIDSESEKLKSSSVIASEHKLAWQSTKTDSKKWDLESQTTQTADSKTMDCRADKSARNDSRLESKKVAEFTMAGDSEKPNSESKDQTEFAIDSESKKPANRDTSNYRPQYDKDLESANQVESAKALVSKKWDLESKRLKSKDISAFTKPQYDNDLDSKQAALSHKAAQHNIFIFNISTLLGEYAHKAGLPTQINLLDESKEAITGTRLSNAACLALAQILGLKLLPALMLPSLKAIVCDLDNTLYAGVLGEDGIEKLTLAPAHKALQEQILSYKKQGFLLAIASKNDLRDVEALFQKRLDFPLRLSDFSCVQAHWEGKAQSLEAIAKSFNIGLDSLLFIDDNIAELESTRHTKVKQIHALSPAHTLFALYLYPQMTRLVENKEDSLRSSDIAANAARAHLEALSDEEYFTNLGIELEFCINPKQSAQRIHELLNKTNQFIANYARPTLTEVQEWIEGEGYCVVAISMRDRLSESGIIGIVVGSFTREHSASLGNSAFERFCGSLPRSHCGARLSAPHSRETSQPTNSSQNPRIAEKPKSIALESAPLQNLKSPTDSTTPTRHSKISKETARGLFCDDKSGLSSEQARNKTHCLESSDSQAAGFSDDVCGFTKETSQACFQAKGEGSYLEGNDRALSVESAKAGDSQGEVSCDDFRGCVGASKGVSKPNGENLKTPTESRHSKICDDKSGLSSEQARNKTHCLESSDSQAAGFSDDVCGFTKETSQACFQAKGEGSYLEGNDRALSVESAKSTEKPTLLAQARIIELVISCRALGRRLESFMLLQSFALIAETLGADTDYITLAYQKGERNTPFLRTLATLITTQSTDQSENKIVAQTPHDLSEQALNALKERGELAIPLSLPPAQGLSIHIKKEQK